MTGLASVGWMDVTARARRWADHDPDPADRDTVRGWLEAADRGDEQAHRRLSAAFAGPLEFGTAGLRGPIGPGESAMNRAVVIRTTAGLVAHLAPRTDGRPRVVIGYDARHGSSAFARDAAEVVAGAGGQALLLPGPLPTPVLAFAVRALDADAGVMITASHNPARDNGYKVYLGGRAVGAVDSADGTDSAGGTDRVDRADSTDDPGRGVQIVPPADAQIAAAIEAAPAADEVPRGTDGLRQLGDDIIADYLRRAATLTTPPPRGLRRPVRVVLTPLHGVGGFVAHEALAATGFVEVHLVSQQAAPDPDFPTVTFPNPEEPGALALALTRAREVGADLVIALDPDADRCSVAVPADVEGGWQQLSGDELGALLGDDAARRVVEATGSTTSAGSTSPAGVAGSVGPDAGGAVLASSIVSSRLLGAIAEHHGLRHVTTLTGFKWIARVPGLVFGYEEAIGYCTDPAAVRDKDGITTALRVVDLAARLAVDGRGLLDALDDLARRHGLYATAPMTFRVDRLEEIGAAMTRLRAQPPRTLGGSPVETVVDLADGVPDLGLPPTDGLLLTSGAGDRVVVRPSGTEPKLKCYLEAVLACPPRGPVPHEEAGDRLRLLAADVTAAIGLAPGE